MEPFGTPFTPPSRPKLVDRFFGFIHHLPISDSFILKGVLLVTAVFFMWTLIAFSTYSQVEVPSEGGSLTEGIVGTPRFVNPVLAFTRADRDLVALVFDGLMKLGPDGRLVPNIAESVTIADDGLAYNVVLKKNIRFHDGTPLTALDVAFTVDRIKEPALSSPLRASFEGVTVEQISDYELNFILPEPYSPFIENLTFGVLPHHIWKDASNEEFPFSQHNSEAIGSGPYLIEKIIRNASGIPEAFVLTSNQNYHAGVAPIETLTLHFYSNENRLILAFNQGEVDSVAGIDQKRLPELTLNPDTHAVLRLPQPRTFALFFNQNRSVALRDAKVREALDVAIDRDELIETVLSGYAQPLNSPIPPWFSAAEKVELPAPPQERLDAARAILQDAGWKINPESGVWEKTIDDTRTELTFSIATANTAVFEATAEYLRKTWEQIGVPVTIKQFEQSDLTQAVIRPRDYEALLFGTTVGRALDFYSFWHSSNRNDPGLNVALYANITVDSVLSEMRRTHDTEALDASRAQFATELMKETPALFLFSPEFIYVFPTRVVGASFTGAAESQERFATITNWFTNTEFIWPLFKN